MEKFTIIIAILSAVAILIGLMLSSSGSTAGLTAMNGQDLELFKKTKDRGLIKLLQIILFLIIFAILVLLCI
jgi:preprotein translocase subunit SecG